MPVPLLLFGLGAAAAAVGAGGHLSAKETNEQAQNISDKAQNLYNNEKELLEFAQKQTEDSLLKLGYSKKKILETSINQFLIAYERIKNIELKESSGFNEIKNFTLEEQDALQLREMSDIYQSTFSSSVAGATTGAIVALAASGSLPIVTGVLSTAGTALMAGEIGMAAGLAGSALSLGATMTPLSAVAAPIILFTGISSSIKADENLEKAKTMYAEAEVAVEQMKNSEILCKAISDRAEMFDNLLDQLNQMFSQCTALLDGVTRKKINFFHKSIKAQDLSEEEEKLVYITRALASAVKSVIDTPILTEKGAISPKVQEVCDNVIENLPSFSNKVNEIKSFNYKVKTIPATSKEKQEYDISLSLVDIIRNIFAIICGIYIFKSIQSTFILKLAILSTVILSIINNNTEIKIFKYVKDCCCFILGISFSIFFWKYGKYMIDIEHYIIFNFIIGIISFIILGICMPNQNQTVSSIKRTLGRIFGCILFYTFSILLFAFLYKLIRLPRILAFIITFLLYVICSLSVTCADNL